MTTKKIALLLLGVFAHNIQILAGTIKPINIEAITTKKVFQNMSGQEAHDLYDKWIKSYASLCTDDTQSNDLSKDLVRISYCVRQYQNLDGIRTIRSDVLKREDVLAYNEHTQYIDYDIFWQGLLNKKNQESSSEFTKKP